VGGNVEAVVDGQTAFVVPARDSQRLSTAIVQLAPLAVGELPNVLEYNGFPEVIVRCMRGWSREASD
jgi:hypothetical protein